MFSIIDSRTIDFSVTSHSLEALKFRGGSLENSLLVGRSSVSIGCTPVGVGCVRARIRRRAEANKALRKYFRFREKFVSDGEIWGGEGAHAPNLEGERDRYSAIARDPGRLREGENACAERVADDGKLRDEKAREYFCDIVPITDMCRGEGGYSSKNR